MRRLAVLLVFVVSATSLSAQTKPKPPKPVLKPEPLTLMPGQPMSNRALTQKPAILQGIRGWTLETRRHRGPMYAFAFSPDEKLVATGGHDGTIRIWELPSGKYLRSLVGHHYYVSSLAWSPDGKLLASAGGGEATVRIWDPHLAQPLRKFTTEKGYAGIVTWAPDGLILAVSGGASGFVWFFDVNADKAAYSTDETGNPISSLTWSPDGQTLAACSTRTPVWLFQRETKKLSGTIGEAGDGALATAWSPDGKMLAVGSQTAIHLWDPVENKKLGKLEGPGSSMAFFADGKTLAACYTNGPVSLWDVDSRKQKPPLPAGTNAYVLGRSPASNTLVLLTYNTLTLRPEGAASPTVFDLGSQNPVAWTAGRPMVSGLGENTPALWNATTFKRIAALEGHKAAVGSFAWSKDGKLLATGGYDGQVIVWDGATGKRQCLCDGNAGTVISLSWSPDGKMLASGATDHTVSIWDAATGQRNHKFEGHRGAVYALAWCPAGKVLAAGGYDNPVKLWNVETGKLSESLKGYPAGYMVAWNPAGKILCTGGASDPTRYWQSLGTPPPVIGTPGPQPPITQLTWSPSGDLVALNRGSSGAYIYNVKTAQQVHGLSNWAGVTRISFSAKGETLAVGANDRTVRFWDVATGQHRASLFIDPTGLVATIPEGHYRADAAPEADLVFVTQTEKGQESLPPARFFAKYRWKNTPSLVKLTN